MEAIIVFLSSFFGAFLAIYLYFQIKRPKHTTKGKQSHPRSLQLVKIKADPTKARVLHSPTPEEEEKEKMRKFEEAVYTRRQNKERISEDYRKI